MDFSEIKEVMESFKKDDLTFKVLLDSIFEQMQVDCSIPEEEEVLEELINVATAELERIETQQKVLKQAFNFMQNGDLTEQFTEFLADSK